MAPAVPLFHLRSYRLYILLLLMIVYTCTSINYMHLGNSNKKEKTQKIRAHSYLYD
jgi:hypothetical protein